MQLQLAILIIHVIPVFCIRVQSHHLLMLNNVCICVCVFSRVSGVWPFTFRMGLRRIVMPLGQWNRRWAAVPVRPAPLSRCHWDSHRTSTTSRHRPTAALRVMATPTLSLVSACYHPFPTHTRSCIHQSAYICSIFTTVGMSTSLGERRLGWGDSAADRKEIKILLMYLYCM